MPNTRGGNMIGILIIAKISEADLLEILDNPIAAIVPVIEDTIATDTPIVMLFIKQLTNCLWLKISIHHLREKLLIGKLAIALSVNAKSTTRKIGEIKKNERIIAKIIERYFCIFILDQSI